MFCHDQHCWRHGEGRGRGGGEGKGEGGGKGPALHGPVDMYRNDSDRMLPCEQYLKVILSRVGWSRAMSSLTLEEVCKVG